MAETPQTPPAKGKPKFTKLRQVTLPVLKLKPNTERYVYFIGPMHIGETIEAKAKDGAPAKPKKEPATIAHALDMETGEEGIVICAAMLKGELNKHYPGERYVGRGFSISQTRIPDKDYNQVTICEVAVPDDVSAAGAAIRKALQMSEGALKAVG